MGFSLQTKDPNIVYFANETSRYYERMQLIEALELLISPQDSENAKRVEFTWNMTGYNQDYIWLQLTFINLWDISDDA